MNISIKHHYLPKFYLNGFTNEVGTFVVYDCGKAQVKKGLHSPSSHFFEKNRNTIQFEGRFSDLPEQHFGYSENHQSKFLRKIQTSQLVSLNSEEFITLQDFVSSIFWRIPANDQLYLEQYGKDPMLTYIRGILRKILGKEATNEAVEKLRKSEVCIKALRPAAASASLHANQTNDFEEWRITYTNSENQLSGDSPIVSLKQNASNIFQGDIIFPLSKNHLLIKSRSTFTKDKLTEIKLLADILIFRQSTAFCCCANSEYLNLIMENAQKFTVKELRMLLNEAFEKSSNG